MKDLDRLAAAIRTLPVSCGPVRLVAVDGHAGSGKSTFSAKLAGALGGAPVLHLDDLATHQQLFDWTDRLHAQVIEPFTRGAPARYAPYDWTLRDFGPERTMDPADVVVVEGVGAGRRALRPYLARLLWMDRPAGSSWSRGRHRDGLGCWRTSGTAGPSPRCATSPHDPSRPFADVMVRECKEGYEWFQAPAVTA